MVNFKTITFVLEGQFFPRSHKRRSRESAARITRHRNLPLALPSALRSFRARTDADAAFVQSPLRFGPKLRADGSSAKPAVGAAIGQWLPGERRRGARAFANQPPSDVLSWGHGRWTCGDRRSCVQYECCRTCVSQAVKGRLFRRREIQWELQRIINNTQRFQAIRKLIASNSTLENEL